MFRRRWLASLIQSALLSALVISCGGPLGPAPASVPDAAQESTQASESAAQTGPTPASGDRSGGGVLSEGGTQSSEGGTQSEDTAPRTGDQPRTGTPLGGAQPHVVGGAPPKTEEVYRPGGGIHLTNWKAKLNGACIHAGYQPGCLPITYDTKDGGDDPNQVGYKCDVTNVSPGSANRSYPVKVGTLITLKVENCEPDTSNGSSGTDTTTGTGKNKDGTNSTHDTGKNKDGTNGPGDTGKNKDRTNSTHDTGKNKDRTEQGG